MTARQALETNCLADRPLPLKDPRGILAPENRREYRIQDGFWVSCLDIEARQTLRLEYEKVRPTLNFGFILSGNYINRFSAPGLTRQQFSGHAGTSGILYFPHQSGELIIPDNTHVRVVHIHLSPSVFHDLYHSEEASVPRELKPVLTGSVDRSYAFRAGMSPRIRSVLERMVKGPSLGIPTRLFYQGIALDLISAEIARANACPQYSERLSHDDQDRVMRARDLLIRDLAEPPCLKQLSRTIGMNLNKLQQGFHLLYGVSVFKYLQQYRMQEANRLFHETDVNVSQAAAAVGYSNISHFSRAYKKHFDILPKQHLLCIKNRN